MSSFYSNNYKNFNNASAYSKNDSFYSDEISSDDSFINKKETKSLANEFLKIAKEKSSYNDTPNYYR